MPRSSYIQRLLYSTYPDYHISNAYCILHASTIISPTPTVSCMPKPSYLQCILHSTCPDHHIANAYSILHAHTIISPMHTAFYTPRPLYLQCILHSTWPNHHISNAYHLLYAPISQLPSVRIVMILILHRLHSPLTSSFPDTSIPVSKFSQTFLYAPFQILKRHMPDLNLTLLQACVLSAFWQTKPRNIICRHKNSFECINLLVYRWDTEREAIFDLNV